MKNHLLFMKNDDGFVLPYVLFIAALIFIGLLVNIKTYDHDIKMTAQHMEQLKIESIVQMGRVMVKNDLLTDDSLKKARYTFPDGGIVIEIIHVENHEYHLHMTIVTNNNSHYTIRNRLILNEMKVSTM